MHVRQATFARYLLQEPMQIRSKSTVVSVVGVRGFEPPTPCTPCRCANRTAPHPVLWNETILSQFVTNLQEEI